MEKLPPVPLTQIKVVGIANKTDLRPCASRRKGREAAPAEVGLFDPFWPFASAFSR